MNPAKVNRGTTKTLTDLPNVGPAIARDLRKIGIEQPTDLLGKDALDLYQQLSNVTGIRQDPCVMDVFLSITDFMNGGPPQPWWNFTKNRKQEFGQLKS